MADLTLSDDGKDLAIEMFNIGMNRAAGSLARLTGLDVSMEIPKMSISTVDKFCEQFSTDGAVAVSQTVNGPFSGTALLLFMPGTSYAVISKLLDEDCPQEVIVEMSQDALMEVGNIILNASIGAISNWIKKEFQIGLPKFLQGDFRNIILKGGALVDTDKMLNVEVEISVSGVNHPGSLVFVMGPVGMTEFEAMISSQLDNPLFMHIEDEGLVH